MSLRICFQDGVVAGPELAGITTAPDTAFIGNNTLVKSDRTTSLSVVEISTGKILVKRYNTKNLWHSVRRNFQRSRAVNCMKMAAQFAECGILVPRTLAVVEEHFGPFAGRSWYVSDFVEGETLLDWVSRKQGSELAPTLIDQVVTLFKIMLQYGLSHGDMKATNMIVSGERVYVIDLDAARQHRSHSSHARAMARDKSRFLRNWDAYPQLQKDLRARLEALGI